MQLSNSPCHYADDTFLYRQIQGENDSLSLQRDLDKISAWSNRNLLLLNPGKCKFLSISRMRRWSYQASYSINNMLIQEVTELKLLGVLVQNNLSWDAHVNFVTGRSYRTLGFIRHVVGDCNSKTLLTLYKSIVLPLLDYCSPVWHIYRVKHETRLEKVQRYATRLMLHQRRQEQPYNSRLIETGLSTLSNRREYLFFAFVCKQLVTHNHTGALSSCLCKILVNARHKDKLVYHHLSARTDLFKFSIPCRFARGWSNLPTDLVNDFICAPLQEFLSKLKNHFDV